MILAINPGSTSTKIAIFEGKNEKIKTNIEHSAHELEKYNSVAEQYEMRKEAIETILKDNGFNINDLDGIASRGGPLPSTKGGAYEISNEMVDIYRNNPVAEHASNLAAIIGFEIAQEINVPAYIYDAISTDELTDIARISGMPAIPRTSLVHALNVKAVSRIVAEKMGEKYEDMNIIIAHLGGGITVSIHQGGKMVDIVSDDEGPFSPERAGKVPSRALIDECYSGKYEYSTMKKMLRGKGGLVAYTGTSNALEVEKMIEVGDDNARLVYEAMAYQVAKGIGELATVVGGNVDIIILTGGIAYSKMMTDWISSRVEFIAPVEVSPGENEMEALAFGVMRVLNGEEKARKYDLD